MSKPHIILVPGGWHTPAFFEPITALLQTHGYTVTSLHPPSIGNPNPPKDLTQDIAALQALVTDAIGPGNDVVVVAHSWGGILLSSGLTSFGKKQREERGEKGGVVKCGYMCAFLVPEGVAALDAAGVGDDMSKIRFWWRISDSGDQTQVVDPTPLYHDLPPAEQKHWAEQLMSHSLGTMRAKTTAASWKEIPSSYLVCEEDRILPPTGQMAMVEGATAMGAQIEVERMKTGHSPFLSNVAETVGWVRRVAGERV